MVGFQVDAGGQYAVFGGVMDINNFPDFGGLGTFQFLVESEHFQVVGIDDPGGAVGLPGQADGDA